MNRHKFITHTTMAVFGALSGIGSKHLYSANYSKIKIGICADVHLDTVHDGIQRLESFIDEMEIEQPDFIIQLGDFCGPLERNFSIMNIWDRFNGPKHHVLGNHDQDQVDGNSVVGSYYYTRNQVIDFWKMKGNYYSFDQNGYHFMILDANEHEQNPNRNPNINYGSYIGDDQLKWMIDDLDNTKLPTIVFIHQGLDNDRGGVENATKVRYVLEQANEKSKFKKVLLVFSGHHHLDYHNVINGIHYFQINSMSYNWVGGEYPHVPYTKEINRNFPLTEFTIPYKEPIWAIAEISSSGFFKLKGKKSYYVNKSPDELGIPKYEKPYPIVPYISDRNLKLDSECV